MKSKEILLPGEFVEERKGRKLGNGVYSEGENVLSKVLGIPRIDENEISVTALSGVYMPKIGDKVVGVIEGIEISGWTVDINAPYNAFLPISEAVDEFIDRDRCDLSKYFDIGDMIFCRVSKVTKHKVVQVSMDDYNAKKLNNGIIIKVTPTKIPRIIGKAGSMIQMIKEKTECDLTTGQNGIVWIRGENKGKAIETILTIEHESHTVGLTEKIEKMLG
jgi:exosome complex component RRP4